MAISYTDLFRDVGKLIKYYDAFASTAQGLDTIVDAIEVAFATDHQEAAVDGLRPGEEQSWAEEYTGRRASLAEFSANRLTDVTSVVQELDIPTDDIDTVLAALIERMTADTESVNASSLSIGSVTANAGNVGDGTVLVTALLDRVTSPGSRQGTTFASQHGYGDVLSELGITETMTVRCQADSFADNRVEGSESFEWHGEIEDSKHGVATLEGSGSLSSVTGIHDGTPTFLQNADFETFTVTNTPDSWTIDAGAVTTNIVKATGANAYHGSFGLKLLGDGATASIQLSQAFSTSKIKAGKRYCVTCRLKADATIAAGDLTIQFEGTGYTAGAAEKITVAHGALPTGWTLKSFFVMMPLSIPSDFKFVVKWNGTPTNAKAIYLDDFGMGEVIYSAGIGIVVVRGATAFVRDDRFTFTLTATEGVVQKFFRRAFGVQLPSNSGGTETIADSVAT